jgi:hypothetical protein
VNEGLEGVTMEAFLTKFIVLACSLFWGWGGTEEEPLYFVACSFLPRINYFVACDNTPTRGKVLFRNRSSDFCFESGYGKFLFQIQNMDYYCCVTAGFAGRITAHVSSFVYSSADRSNRFYCRNKK